MAIPVTIEVTSPRLRAMPAYVALQESLRAGGFEPVDRVPTETRDAGTAAVLVLLHVAEDLTALGLVELTRLIRLWVRDHVRPAQSSARAADTIMVAIYGPRGEILSEVAVRPGDDENLTS